MMEKGVCSFLVSTRRDKRALQQTHESIPVDTETLTQHTCISSSSMLACLSGYIPQTVSSSLDVVFAKTLHPWR